MINSFQEHKKELRELGYSITEVIFSKKEVRELINKIEDCHNEYSMRQLLNKVPEIEEMLFQNKLFRKLLETVCDSSYFLSKAIYFNKQSKSNWFVGYHQDISISVKEQKETFGFSQWTRKKGQLGVVPPLKILENIVTLRIYLDATNKVNGALKVIERSHTNGFIRIYKDFDKSKYGREVVCEIDEGGIMLMKPMILHASDKSISQTHRRVLHLEFSNQEIPMGWLEKKKIS